MKYFLIFLTVIGLSLSAREILEDPTFKKKDKYWRLTAFEEYKNVEPKYKRKTVEFDISHTSEASYISYITEADTKDDRIYKIEFKFKVLHGFAWFAIISKKVVLMIKFDLPQLNKIKRTTYVNR